MTRHTAPGAMRLTGLALGLGLVASGCYSAELDPEADGAFRCVDDGECPGSLRCDGRFCVNDEHLPSVDILTPEDLQVIGGSVVSVNVGSNLTLVEPGSPVVVGEGHIIITVDGMETMVPGVLGPLELPLLGDGQVGPHRIQAEARRSDGTPYENADAKARRIVWIPDGDTPLVAISKPWPGTPITTEATTLNFEVVAFKFTFGVPVNNEVPGTGHAHIHYDSSDAARTFAACVEETICDDGYVAVLSPGDAGPERAIGVAQIPADMAGPVNIGAILRNNTHTPFFFDPGTPGVEPFNVRDEITVERVTPTAE